MFDKTLKKTFFVDRCFIFKNKIVVGCLTTFFAQKKLNRKHNNKLHKSVKSGVLLDKKVHWKGEKNLIENVSVHQYMKFFANFVMWGYLRRKNYFYLWSQFRISLWITAKWVHSWPDSSLLIEKINKNQTIINIHKQTKKTRKILKNKVTFTSTQMQDI